MIIERDEDGDEYLAYSEAERAAIVASFPSEIGPTVPLSGEYWRADWHILRKLTWAANSYVTSWQYAPERHHIQTRREEREELLRQIDGVHKAASKIKDHALKERLEALRATAEKVSFWETQYDPRGCVHRNEYLNKVFGVWAELKGIPLAKCQISAVDGSPMLNFIQSVAGPVFEITKEGVEAEMLRKLLTTAKQA